MGYWARKSSDGPKMSKHSTLLEFFSFFFENNSYILLPKQRNEIVRFHGFS
jgi:hypothetical protein